MPGFEFSGQQGGSSPEPPYVGRILGKSMTGTGTPPAAALKTGDIVCLSSHSAVAGSSENVIRVLLAADKTANYEDGSSNVCGIFGVVDSNVSTNPSGQATGEEISLGGVLYSVPSYPASLPYDRDTGRSLIRVIPFTDETIFRAKLNSGTASAAIVGELAGLTLSTTSGVTTFTINQSDAAAIRPLVIVGYDQNDTTYVFVKARRSFQQAATGFIYTAQ